LIVAENVKVDAITSSSLCTPNKISARCIAAVPEHNAAAYFTPQYFAIDFSKGLLAFWSQ